MDSLVGIKFRPIIKRIEKQPECCIEIIPEISYVENLNSLKFTESNGCLQYTLPITYKILVKKTKNVEKADKYISLKENKIYHSCIDLLPSSSNVSENLASGNVFNKASDNIFLSKLSKCDIELINTKKYVTFQNKYPDVKQDFKSYDTSPLCNSVFSNYLTKNINTLEHITKKVKVNNEKRNIHLNEVAPMESRLLFYPSQHYTVKEFTNTPQKVNYKRSDILFRSEHGMPKEENTQRRHTTQVRIARNLAKLETEINPLKEMLDNIIRKCDQNVRLQKAKKLIKNNKYSLEDNKFSQSKQAQKVLSHEKNRVLYSVVCDV